MFGVSHAILGESYEARVLIQSKHETPSRCGLFSFQCSAQQSKAIGKFDNHCQVYDFAKTFDVLCVCLVSSILALLGNRRSIPTKCILKPKGIVIR